MQNVSSTSAPCHTTSTASADDPEDVGGNRQRRGAQEHEGPSLPGWRRVRRQTGHGAGGVQRRESAARIGDLRAGPLPGAVSSPRRTPESRASARPRPSPPWRSGGAACGSARSCRAGSAARPRERAAERGWPASDPRRERAATDPAARSRSTRPTAAACACPRRARGAASAGISNTNPQALALRGLSLESASAPGRCEIRDDRRHQHPVRVVPHAHRPAFPEEHHGRRVEDEKLSTSRQRPAERHCGARRSQPRGVAAAAVETVVEARSARGRLHALAGDRLQRPLRVA